MFLLLEFTIYLIMLITDTLILTILQLLNPYYGQNSGSYAAKVLDVMTELQNMNVDEMSGTEYFTRATENLKIAHHCAWNIILNG